MSPFLVMRNTKHVVISFGTQLVIPVPIHNVCNKGCGNISMICLGHYGSFVCVNLKNHTHGFVMVKAMSLGCGWNDMMHYIISWKVG